MPRLIGQAIDIFKGDGLHPFARTGKLSGELVRHAGASGVIVGHSESGDTPEICNLKLKAALEAGLEDNILLFGESWADLRAPWKELSAPEQGAIASKICGTMRVMIDGVKPDSLKKLVLGYEPGWGTRGSGQAGAEPPGVEQVSSVAAAIRLELSNLLPPPLNDQLRVIYGGSLSPERALELMQADLLDGFILGSAGTTTAWTEQIAQAIVSARKKSPSVRRPVLVLNWKAFLLEEPYERFLNCVRGFEEKIDIYAAPAATDLRLMERFIR